MGGGSGEYLARRLFFTLETSGAGVALADQIRTLEDTPPGGVRVSFAASDPGPGVDADGVILVDGADGTWAVERARGLHEAGFHGLVVAVSPVVKRDVLVAGFAAGVHLWESPPIDAEVFAANLHR